MRVVINPDGGVSCAERLPSLHLLPSAVARLGRWSSSAPPPDAAVKPSGTFQHQHRFCRWRGVLELLPRFCFPTLKPAAPYSERYSAERAEYRSPSERRAMAAACHDLLAGCACRAADTKGGAVNGAVLADQHQQPEGSRAAGAT